MLIINLTTLEHIETAINDLSFIFADFTRASKGLTLTKLLAGARHRKRKSAKISSENQDIH